MYVQFTSCVYGVRKPVWRYHDYYQLSKKSHLQHILCWTKYVVCYFQQQRIEEFQRHSICMLNHSRCKKWMLVNEKSFKYKDYEIGYAVLSEKVTVLKKYLNKSLWRSSSSKEVLTSKKYMFWMITYSGKKAPSKQ